MAVPYQPGLLSEALVSPGGQFTTAVTAAQIAAGPVVIKGAPGRLCQVLVTTTLTSAQSITFYDNASAGSGTIVGLTAAAATASTIYVFNSPCANGITIGQNASLAAGAITVSWI